MGQPVAACDRGMAPMMAAGELSSSATTTTIIVDLALQLHAAAADSAEVSLSAAAGSDAVRNMHASARAAIRGRLDSNSKNDQI